MIKSMTAFARVDEQNEWGELAWELRSVNHRYLEIQPRLPEELRRLEPVLRERISQYLKRGKVECGLRYKPAPETVASVRVNQALLDELLEAMQQLEDCYPQMRPATSLEMLAWPGLLLQQDVDLTPLQALALNMLERTLQELVATREREGTRLQILILQRCDALEKLIEKARIAMPRIIEGVRQRLRARLLEVSDNLDAERLEQEMALLAQRLDVDEEMDRLNTHLQEVRQVLERDEPVGRRLDFLMQELNREANTLGSKSTDSETTAISVEMKVLIEQMREQVQNIE